MKRKGSLPYDAAPEFIIGTIMVFSAITIGAGVVTLVFTGTAEAEDRDQFTDLYNEIKDECEAAYESGPSVAGKSVDLEFNVYEEIRAVDRTLVAEKTDGTTEEEELTGCVYSFSGFPAEAENSTKWTFVIDQADSESYPPTISVEASQ